MSITAKKIPALCCAAAVLVLMGGLLAVPARAVENGIYLASAYPHYQHPVTGEIEDAGGPDSAVLGQSMTESATYKKALVEVDPDGNMFVTVRLQLMDSIVNPQFQVDGYSVSSSCMQEDYGSNTADFRMRVNSEYSVIRCSMTVTAMGRDVVFYITVANLQPGSGDFITSVEVKPTEPAQTEPAETSGPAEPSTAPETEQTTEAPAESVPAAAEATAPVTTVPETTVQETVAPATTVPETTAPETTAPMTTEAAGLQEFDDSGDRVEETTAPQQEEKTGPNTGAILWVILAVIAAAALGFAVWYFGFFRKK